MPNKTELNKRLGEVEMGYQERCIEVARLTAINRDLIKRLDDLRRRSIGWRAKQLWKRLRREY